MGSSALVISGGGSKGAFAVGAIRSMYRRYRENGWFSIVGGSSTGAIIAPLAALLGAPEPMSSNAFKTMQHFYSHVTTTSILERKGVVGVFQRQHSFNKLTPFRALVDRLFLPECFQWLQSDEAPECYVVYVNYKSAKKVFASPKDPGMNREKFMQAMLASVTVPVFIEPTIIDNEACFDGGLRDVIPFGRAIDLGAETIVPIFLHPDGMDHSDDEFRRLSKVLQRTMLIMMDETLRNDYELAKLINVGIQAKTEIIKVVKNHPQLKKKIEMIYGREEFRELYGERKRLVKIVTGIRPDTTLTDEPLVFKPRLMRNWMNLGDKKADEVVLTSPF